MLAGCQVSEDELEKSITDKGFSILQPPSRLFVPGSLVYRRNYDPKDTTLAKVTLDFLCNREFSVSLYDKQPTPSSGQDQFSVIKIGGNISAGLPTLGRLVALNAKLKAARSITLDVSNVTYYAFSKEDLGAIREKLGPKCRGYVNDNVASNNAYQVIQVLEATVNVVVQLDAAADVTAKAQFVRQLVNLGFGAAGEETSILKGTALYYGVQLEPIATPVPEVEGPAVASTRFGSSKSLASKRSPAPRQSSSPTPYQVFANLH